MQPYTLLCSPFADVRHSGNVCDELVLLNVKNVACFQTQGVCIANNFPMFRIKGGGGEWICEFLPAIQYLFYRPKKAISVERNFPKKKKKKKDERSFFQQRTAST